MPSTSVENTSAIAAHHPFVDEPSQPARAGKHREKRRLGKRHRGVAVVDEQYLVGRKRELVAATGRDAVERGQILLSALAARFFHAEPGLVRVLAEVDFEAVGRGRQHKDVGAGGKDAVFAARNDDGLDLGMLEAQTLDRVRELDVDP